MSKQQRQQAAAIRAEEASKRSPKEQLALLDAKFGEGKGATKERAKLAIKIAQAKEEKEAKKKKKKKDEES